MHPPFWAKSGVNVVVLVIVVSPLSHQPSLWGVSEIQFIWGEVSLLLSRVEEEKDFVYYGQPQGKIPHILSFP